MQTIEKNRLQIMLKEVSMSIKPVLTMFKNQIKKTEEKITKIIEKSPEYSTKNEILQSMTGIGKIVAASIISNLLELGYINSKQASVLIGVAPMNRESGRFQGH